jgi:hypothetical protein
VFDGLGLAQRSLVLIFLAIAAVLAPLVIAAARESPFGVPSSLRRDSSHRRRRDRTALLSLGILAAIGAAYGFFFTEASLGGLVSGICLSLIAILSLLAWYGRRPAG